MLKKMLPWLIMILIVITLIILAAFILWNFIMKDPGTTDPNTKSQDITDTVEPLQLSAEQKVNLSFHIEEVKTNLAELNYYFMSNFAFLLDNEDAKTEMELLEPWIRGLIEEILSDTSPEDIKGSKGRDALKATLINRINPLLQKGKLLEVDMYNFIISHR